MKIITIHDTKKSLLKSNYSGSDAGRMVRFLPSIALFRQDKKFNIYLLTYRIWRKRIKPKQNIMNMNDIGHPWTHQWGKKNGKWGNEPSFDSTAFALIKVNKGNSAVSVLKEYIPKNRNSKIDMRILTRTYPKNNRMPSYYVTFNTFGLLSPKRYMNNYKDMKSNINPTCFYYMNNKGKVYKNANNLLIDKNKRFTKAHKTILKKQSWCTFQMRATMHVPKSKFIPRFSNFRLVCAAHHQRFEKNIQPFVDNQANEHYQYAIEPWVFFDKRCTKIMPHKTTMFTNVINYYDNRDISPFGKNIQFSCSTPLIEFDSNTLIASGHFKLVYAKNFVKDSPIYNFLKKAKLMMKMKSLQYQGYEHLIHPEYIYGMFIYTIDKNTFTLRKVSKCFIPIYKNYKQLLTFPSGMTKHSDDTFLIAYHENDMTIRMLEYTKAELDRMLIYDNNTSPSKYQFEFST